MTLQASLQWVLVLSFESCLQRVEQCRAKKKNRVPINESNSHPQLSHQASALIEPTHLLLSQTLGLGLELIIRRHSSWTRISGLQP